jgi:hypothetical protein
MSEARRSSQNEGAAGWVKNETFNFYSANQFTSFVKDLYE